MEGLICFGIALVAIAIFIAAVLRQNAVVAARNAYQRSLEKLKDAPNDPDLRETTLLLGRKYADMTRNNNGVTLFDEVALLNDINAACARAGTIVTISDEHQQSSIELRLTTLDSLLAKQLITTEEHQTRRNRILDEL